MKFWKLFSYRSKVQISKWNVRNTRFVSMYRCNIAEEGLLDRKNIICSVQSRIAVLESKALNPVNHAWEDAKYLIRHFLERWRTHAEGGLVYKHSYCAGPEDRDIRAIQIHDLQDATFFFLQNTNLYIENAMDLTAGVRFPAWAVFSLLLKIQTSPRAGGRLLWYRHTKTYSPIRQVPQYIPETTLLRSSLSMHEFCVYNNFISVPDTLTAHRRVISEQPFYVWLKILTYSMKSVIQI
jgi:hypothetical protein